MIKGKTATIRPVGEGGVSEGAHVEVLGSCGRW
jgi:hypothetical protein